MIDPVRFLKGVIRPGCGMVGAMLGRPDMGSPEAYVPMLTIGVQESSLEHRRQVDSKGNPIDHLARGWFQFEEGGGVEGVMTHPASAKAAELLCAALYVPFDEDDIHEAIAWNGPLAAAFARLLLYTDPKPLPDLGDEAGCWDYYIRLWRPGKPHPETWSANYALAIKTVCG